MLCPALCKGHLVGFSVYVPSLPLYITNQNALEITLLAQDDTAHIQAVLF